MLTALRILNVCIWATLFIYMITQGGWAAIRRKGMRRGDPLRLSVAAVAAVIVLGNLRFLLAPSNDQMFAAIYILSALVGLYKVALGRVYGRGPLL